MSILFFFFFFLLVPCYSYKILVYNMKFGHSNSNFMGSIADILVDAGHEVVSLIPELDPSLADGTTRSRIIRVLADPKGTEDIREFADEESNLFEANCYNPTMAYFINQFFTDGFTALCRKTLETPGLIENLKEEQFDVFIVETFDVCGMGMAPLFAPKSTIIVSASVFIGDQHDEIGVPQMLSFNPSQLTTRLNVHSMVERAWNVVSEIVTRFQFGGIRPAIDALMREKFGADYPGVMETASNAAYAFTNTEPLIDFATPTLHRVIAVGGLGAKEPVALGEEWLEILGRRNGTILLSFGSVAKSMFLPGAAKKAILETIQHFPDITFIWKYERDDDFTTNEASKVANVVFKKWTPQNDLLSDPRIALFITHGGMGSTQETARRGVPALVVPIFGDQPRNAFMMQHNGLGTVFDKLDLIHAHKLISAIEGILNDDRFAKKSALVAAMIAAKPFSATELLVKHVEFAAEYGASPALRPQSLDMTLIEYYNIDIIGISLLIVVFITIAAVKKVLFILLFLSVLLIEDGKCLDCDTANLDEINKFTCGNKSLEDDRKHKCATKSMLSKEIYCVMTVVITDGIRKSETRRERQILDYKKNRTDMTCLDNTDLTFVVSCNSECNIDDEEVLKKCGAKYMKCDKKYYAYSEPEIKANQTDQVCQLEYISGGKKSKGHPIQVYKHNVTNYNISDAPVFANSTLTRCHVNCFVGDCDNVEQSKIEALCYDPNNPSSGTGNRTGGMAGSSSASDSGMQNWIIGGSCALLVVVVVIFLICAFLAWRRRKAEAEESRRCDQLQDEREKKEQKERDELNAALKAEQSQNEAEESKAKAKLQQAKKEIDDFDRAEDIDNKNNRKGKKQLEKEQKEKAKKDQKEEAMKHQFAKGEIIENPKGHRNKYKVIEKLGEGGFGLVYRGSRLNKEGKDVGDECAIKTEPNDMLNFANDRLKAEIAMYRELDKYVQPDEAKYFPRMIDIGRTEFCKYLVMTLLGQSLANLVKVSKEERIRKENAWKTLVDECEKKKIPFEEPFEQVFFKVNYIDWTTVTRVALSALSALRAFHRIGYIHRDIKPHNFCVGRPPNDSTIVLCDFGLAIRIKSPNGKLIPKRTKCRFIGTIRYASRNAARLKEQDPMDDIEAWAFMILELYDIRNTEWRDTNDKKEVTAFKQALLDTLDKYPPNAPPAMIKILEYFKNTKDDEPDYDALAALLKEHLAASKQSVDGPFDFSARPVPKPVRPVVHPVAGSTMGDKANDSTSGTVEEL